MLKRREKVVLSTLIQLFLTHTIILFLLKVGILDAIICNHTFLIRACVIMTTLL